MIRVSVMYPNSAGSRFDMAYYCKTHIPNYTNSQPVI
jgi:hypothetical protein